MYFKGKWKKIELRIDVGATHPPAGTKFYFADDADVKEILSLKIYGAIRGAASTFVPASGSVVVNLDKVLLTLMEKSEQRILNTPTVGYMDVFGGNAITGYKYFEPSIKINWTKSYVMLTTGAGVLTLNAVNIIPFMFQYE